MKWKEWKSRQTLLDLTIGNVSVRGFTTRDKIIMTAQEIAELRRQGQ